MDWLHFLIKHIQLSTCKRQRYEQIISCNVRFTYGYMGIKEEEQTVLAVQLRIRKTDPCGHLLSSFLNATTKSLCPSPILCCFADWISLSNCFYCFFIFTTDSQHHLNIAPIPLMFRLPEEVLSEPANHDPKHTFLVNQSCSWKLPHSLVPRHWYLLPSTVNNLVRILWTTHSDLFLSCLWKTLLEKRLWAKGSLDAQGFIFKVPLNQDT